MADTLTNPMHVEVITPDGPIYRADGHRSGWRSGCWRRRARGRRDSAR